VYINININNVIMKIMKVIIMNENINELIVVMCNNINIIINNNNVYVY